MQDQNSAITQVYVCISCRTPGQPLEPRSERAGAVLYARLRDHPGAADAAIRLVPVDCLSVCKRPCTVGYAAPGKWTYVYGDMPDASFTDTILAGAKLYAAAPDGLIPWKQRPDALKKNVVARIPPLPAAALPMEPTS